VGHSACIAFDGANRDWSCENNVIHTAQSSGVGENRVPGDRIESDVTKRIAILVVPDPVPLPKVYIKLRILVITTAKGIYIKFKIPVRSSLT
jgi:hypothetical protein